MCVLLLVAVCCVCVTASQIREISCGSSCSLAVSASRHTYYFGKLTNRPEATMYPKIEEELYNCPVRSLSAGNNCVFVASENFCIVWGEPVAGKFGLACDARSTSKPKYVERLDGFITQQVSCGYGHVCFIVTPDLDSTAAAATKSSNIKSVEEFPVYVPTQAMTASKSTSAAVGSKKSLNEKTKPVKKIKK
jgi:hypothetical protein